MQELTPDFADAVELKRQLGGDVEGREVGASLHEVGTTDDGAGLPGNQDEVGPGMRVLKEKVSFYSSIEA